MVLCTPVNGKLYLWQLLVGSSVNINPAGVVIVCGCVVARNRCNALRIQSQLTTCSVITNSHDTPTHR